MIHGGKLVLPVLKMHFIASTIRAILAAAAATARAKNGGVNLQGFGDTEGSLS